MRRAVNTVQTSIQSNVVSMTKDNPDLFCYNVEKLSGLMFARIDQVGCRVGERQQFSRSLARGNGRGRGRERERERQKERRAREKKEWAGTAAGGACYRRRDVTQLRGILSCQKMSHMDSGTVQDVLPYLDTTKPGCAFDPPGLEAPTRDASALRFASVAVEMQVSEGRMAIACCV